MLNYNFSAKTNPINKEKDLLKTENAPKEEDENKKGWLIWVQITCLILATFGLFAKLYTKCKSCCKCCVDWRCVGGEEEMNSDIVICYLCNKKVPYNEWVKQETGHRSYCAVKSKEHRGMVFDRTLPPLALAFPVLALLAHVLSALAILAATHAKYDIFKNGDQTIFYFWALT